MKKFSYKAKNNKNEDVQGTINAESIADAALKIEQQGYTVLEINERQSKSIDYSQKTVNKSSSAASSTEFTIQEKKEFFNAFFHMYNSGISVVEIFSSISRSTLNPNIKNFFNLVTKRIEKGNSLRESLKNHYSQLGLAYTMLIAAGEESGKLEDTLSGILKNIKKQDELKASVISALAYPAVVCAIALAVGLLFKFFVLRVFNMMITGSGNLNIPSLLITAIIKIIVIFLIIIFGTICTIKNRQIYGKIKNFISQMKIFGTIIKNFCFANYFYVLSLSYDAGVPISEALLLANSVITIPRYNNQLKKSAQMVQNGCKLSTAIATSDAFSSYAMSQISAGEESGTLGKMFKIIAQDYEDKLDLAISVMKKLIEPTILILIGIGAGILIYNAYASYYKAIFSMF